MLKSRLAFSWSVEAVLTDRCSTFWTFTHPKALGYDEFRKEWHKLQIYLRRRFKEAWKGLRIFEVHLGHPESDYHHGLHVHFLATGFLDVFAVRAVCEHCGWGRINVQRVRNNEACGCYLAKYLTKGRRTPPLKGWRMWAAVNTKDYIRVGDVVIDTTEARCFRYLHKHQWFRDLPFWQRSEISAQLNFSLIGSHTWPDIHGNWPDRHKAKFDFRSWKYQNHARQIMLGEDFASKEIKPDVSPSSTVYLQHTFRPRPALAA